uniref:3-ketoacyl-CoA synthase 4 n=1 Tax=Cajanus cajan TaxID=3821 RepID=A0A151U3U9_CAJCA|nr:3-ketoacyl-CoA synthase 4 [Cajanus cajan]
MTQPKFVYLMDYSCHHPSSPLCLLPAIHELVMFSVLDNLFANTYVKPKHIEILVLNYSLFNPTPPLSAMIMNRYKFHDNVNGFNLGDMGCNTDFITLDLAKDML